MFNWWISGGRGVNGALKSTEVFNVQTQSITSSLDLLVPVYGHCKVVFDASVFIIGGYDGNINQNNNGITKNVFVLMDSSEVTSYLMPDPNRQSPTSQFII